MLSEENETAHKFYQILISYHLILIMHRLLSELHEANAPIGMFI